MQYREISPIFILNYIICITTVKVATDWASNSALNWTADWASDSTHFNRSNVHFLKHYFQSFLGYFSLQISVDLSNTTYLLLKENKENMFLVCLHGEYNILVKLCGNTKLKITWCFHKA